MCPEPPYVHKNLYGVIILGANTLYINFCLFKEIPRLKASKNQCFPGSSVGRALAKTAECRRFESHPGKGTTNNSTTPRTAFFPNKKGAAPGEIRTDDILQSRRALHQLSYKRNSAGRGSNLQHNTTKGKPQTTVLWQSILSLSM